jgi:hypothetical protein
METAPIRMSPTGFKAFVEILSQPARQVPQMVELFQRTAPWEPREAKTEKRAVAIFSRCPLAAAHDVSELFLRRAVSGAGSTPGKSSADRNLPAPRR